MKLKTQKENKRIIETKINGRINTVINPYYPPAHFEREKNRYQHVLENSNQSLS